MTEAMLSPRRERELSEEIRATIEALPRPAFVDHIQYEFRYDSTGEFIVILYVIIQDEPEIIRVRGRKLERTPAGVEAKEFAQRVHEAVLMPFDVFPHVRFRTISEEAEGDSE